MRLERGGEQVDAPDGQADPGVDGQRRQVGHAGHQWQRIKAHQVLAQHPGGGLRHALLQQPAQAPVVLHAVLELGVLRIGDLEVRGSREQFRVALRVGRLVAGDHREQLPLIDQVAVAAQRRAGPEILRDAQPLMRLGLGAHPYLARLLRAVEPGHLGVGEQLPPGAVDVRSSTRPPACRAASRAVAARSSRGRRGRRTNRRESRTPLRGALALAARRSELLRDSPQRAQFVGPFRFARRGERGKALADRVKPKVCRDGHAARAASRAGSAFRRRPPRHRATAPAAPLPAARVNAVQHGLRQHGDLPAGHVHGGQAARGPAASSGEPRAMASGRRCDMDSDFEVAVGEWLAPRTRRRSRSSPHRRSKPRASAARGPLRALG